MRQTIGRKALRPEYKATVNGTLAFFGTYSVSGTDLNLHIEGSSYPNWTGTDQKRTNIAVNGDEFEIYPSPLLPAEAAPLWSYGSA